MTDPSRDRRRSWWDELNDGVEGVTEGELPDPWAETDDEETALTPDQEAFLAGLEDQPAIIRLREMHRETTGSLPGDITTEDS